MDATERVQAAMEELGLPGRVSVFEVSTATVEEAAAAVGCEPGQIVKTLFFLADGRPAVVLVAGDRQADTAKIAQILGVGRKRLKMGSAEQVQEVTGFSVGGVSPVGLGSPCDVVVDESLRRFGQVWAAAGTPNAVFAAEPQSLATAIKGQWGAITRDAEA